MWGRSSDFSALTCSTLVESVLLQQLHQAKRQDLVVLQDHLQGMIGSHVCIKLTKSEKRGMVDGTSIYLP